MRGMATLQSAGESWDPIPAPRHESRARATIVVTSLVLRVRWAGGRLWSPVVWMSAVMVGVSNVSCHLVARL